MQRFNYSVIISKALSFLASIKNVLRRIPFTLIMSGLIMAAGLSTQTFLRTSWPKIMEMFGWFLPALKAGEFYAPWVGLLFGSVPGHWQAIFEMVVVGVGILEFRHGIKWALIGFLLLGPLVGILSVFVMWPLSTTGSSWVNHYLYTPDMGGSAASLVCWGLFVGAERGRWQLLLLWGTVLVMSISWIILPEGWQVDHTLGFLIGLLVSAIWLRRQKGPSEILSQTQKSIIEKVRE